MNDTPSPSLILAPFGHRSTLPSLPPLSASQQPPINESRFAPVCSQTPQAARPVRLHSAQGILNTPRFTQQPSNDQRGGGIARRGAPGITGPWRKPKNAFPEAITTWHRWWPLSAPAVAVVPTVLRRAASEASEANGSFHRRLCFLLPTSPRSSPTLPSVLVSDADACHLLS